MHDAFLAHLHDLLDEPGTVSTRAMFGGHGVYLDGLIVGIVVDEVLYLKTDAGTRARFEAAGSAPFVHTGQEKPIGTSYWSAPDAALESAQAMRPWVELAREAALRKPRGRRRR
jgi:DNA transformation protein